VLSEDLLREPPGNVLDDKAAGAALFLLHVLQRLPCFQQSLQCLLHHAGCSFGFDLQLLPRGIEEGGIHADVVVDGGANTGHIITARRRGLDALSLCASPLYVCHVFIMGRQASMT
jgi:hypothetical protein